MFVSYVYTLVKKILRSSCVKIFGGRYAVICLSYLICVLFGIQANYRSVTWNALFWVINIFAAINASAKSFIQQPESEHLHQYLSVPPQAVIVAKILFNACLLTVISLVTYFFYSLFIGNLVANVPLFLCCLVVGNIGLASILTMVSAMASRANNPTALMTILSFPLLFPLLLILLRLSKNIVDGLNASVDIKYFIMLGSLSALSLALGYILFPYLWRD
jgi:heme exporter protein B